MAIAAPILIRSDSQTASLKAPTSLRWREILLAAMIVVQIIPIWAWTYFPSLDGPSHLYNASVLLNYSKIPLYQQYYRITFDTPGNVLTQLMLSSLLLILPPLAAEKVLLTAYLIAFPLVFRSLIRTVGGDPSFTFFGIVFSYNHFLALGFWNFCVGIPFALAALACALRHRSRPVEGGRIALVAVLALATYLCHPVAWGMLVSAAVSILVFEQFGLTPQKYFPRLRDGLWIIGAAAIPGILVTLFSTRVEGHFVFPQISLLEGARALYELAFLNSYGGTELEVRRILAIAIAVLIVSTALINGLRALKNPLIAFAILCVPYLAFGPIRYGTLAMIRDRVGIFAFLVLFAGLSIAGLPKKYSSFLAIFLSGLSLFALVRKQPAYKYWNMRLSEYSMLEERIEPNSTVLPVHLAGGNWLSIPTVHAADIWTTKPFIDMSNFEAGSVIFPVRFRMAASEWDVSLSWDTFVARMKSAQVPVDYILFDVEPGPLRHDEEIGQTSGILDDFVLEYASPDGGHLRLYRRRS